MKIHGRWHLPVNNAANRCHDTMCYTASALLVDFSMSLNSSSTPWTAWLWQAAQASCMQRHAGELQANKLGTLVDPMHPSR